MIDLVALIKEALPEAREKGVPMLAVGTQGSNTRVFHSPPGFASATPAQFGDHLRGMKWQVHCVISLEYPDEVILHYAEEYQAANRSR